MSRALRQLQELDVLAPFVRSFFGAFVNTPRSAVKGVRPAIGPSPTPTIPQGPAQRFSFTEKPPAARPAAAPPPAPVRRPEPPVMPVFQAPARPAMRAPAPAAAPPTPPAPPTPVAPSASAQSAANFTPLEGNQLDLLSGFNRLRYPKGTTTAEGFKIGGTTFNPADVMPEGEYTQRIRELARSKGVPEEVFINQMQRPGESLADITDYAAIEPRTGLFTNPATFNLYRARNLLNSTVTDLGNMVQGDSFASTVGRSALGLGGATAGLAGVNALMSSFVNPMGPTTADPEVGAKIPAVTGGDPVVTAEPPLGTPDLPGTANPPAPENLEPAGQRRLPPPGTVGAGQVVIRTNDGESSYRQAAANAAAQIKASAPASEAARMYAAERALAVAPGQEPKTLEALRSMGSTAVGVEQQADLDQWIKNNPVLAYRLMQRTRTMPSQQMPMAKQTEIISEAGSNVNKLVEGSVKMGTEDPTGQFQGSSDLRQFMAPRSAAYMGQPPVNMYR